MKTKPSWLHCVREPERKPVPYVPPQVGDVRGPFTSGNGERYFYVYGPGGWLPVFRLHKETEGQLEARTRAYALTLIKT